MIGVSNIIKIISALGSGSSILTAVIAMYLYTQIPQNEKQPFIIFAIILTTIGSIVQILTIIINRPRQKQIEKQVIKLESGDVVVELQEDNKDAMTSIWNYQ